MSNEWSRDFARKMRDFEKRQPPGPGDLPVSIKIRCSSGCFHRDHAPYSYTLIDKARASIPPEIANFSFEEHESGPEILVYSALAAAGLTFAKSIIDLVTAILNSRSKGRIKGDRATHSIELIVRRMDNNSKYKEEIVLKVEDDDPIERRMVERLMNKALKKITIEKDPEE